MFSIQICTGAITICLQPPMLSYGVYQTCTHTTVGPLVHAISDDAADALCHDQDHALRCRTAVGGAKPVV